MKKIITGIVIAALLLVGMGCINPTAKEGSTGSLKVNLQDEINSKTLLPELDIIPASYRLIGTGPEGTSFDQTTANDALTIEYLRFGQWDVHVQAFNAEGYPIGDGTGSAVVNVEGVTPLSVTIRLYDGFGTFDMNVTWVTNEVEFPVVDAVLRSKGNDDINLDLQEMTPAPAGKSGRLVNTGKTIPVGYYTLIVSINDQGDGSLPNHLATGAVEVARIIKDQTTNGSFDLEAVAGMGKLAVNIEEDFDDPIEVVIQNSALLPTAVDFNSGEIFTVQASVPETDKDAGAITYVWYLNSQTVGIDENFTVDMSASPIYQNVDGQYAPGNYRLDVTAFNTDGSRAGSATYEFDVTGNPADNLQRKILFTSDRDGNTEIYMMDENGSNVEQLTVTEGNTSHSQVFWSPDGEKIVFVSNKDGNNDIYVMDKDGQNEINISANTENNFQPSWSPDGSRLAYTTHSETGREIYVVNADGTNKAAISNTDSNTTTWESTPNWTPDGKKIFFNRSIEDSLSDIYIIDANGSNPVNLTADFDARAILTDISPDGSKILFVTTHPNGSEILTMDANGSNIEYLTNAAGQDDCAKWSPDGTKIAYRHFERSGSLAQIKIMNADGSNKRYMTDKSYKSYLCENPWSEDSSMVLFLSNKDGDYDVYVGSARRLATTKLTDNNATDMPTSWQ